MSEHHYDLFLYLSWFFLGAKRKHHASLQFWYFWSHGGFFFTLPNQKPWNLYLHSKSSSDRTLLCRNWLLIIFSSNLLKLQIVNLTLSKFQHASFCLANEKMLFSAFYRKRETWYIRGRIERFSKMWLS